MTRHNGQLNHTRDLQHAATVNAAVRSSVGTVDVDDTYTWNPADAQLLRGIPAVGGRGAIGGAITGTRPDHIPFEHIRRKL